MTLPLLKCCTIPASTSQPRRPRKRGLNSHSRCKLALWPHILSLVPGLNFCSIRSVCAPRDALHQGTRRAGNQLCFSPSGSLPLDRSPAPFAAQPGERGPWHRALGSPRGWEVGEMASPNSLAKPDEGVEAKHTLDSLSSYLVFIGKELSQEKVH